MRLDKIAKLEGTIELLSGLHIGSGNAEMHIGGTDNPVIKNPVTKQPYIPGSSLKGKMRSLMEWHAGIVGRVANQEKGKGKPLGIQHIVGLAGAEKESALQILRLFGYAPLSPSQASKIKEEAGMDIDQLVTEIGPTRLAFWDCELDPQWVKEMNEKNLLLTEVKMETAIDRIQGTAAQGTLRNTERVPAGAKFRFRLTIKVIDGEDLLDEVLRGLKLVELSGLGGSVSRGYGKIEFKELELDGEPVQERLKQVTL